MTIMILCCRYGGLTVGVTFPYVPDSYNSDSKTRDLMKMVAVKENAHVSQNSNEMILTFI